MTVPSPRRCVVAVVTAIGALALTACGSNRPQVEPPAAGVAVAAAAPARSHAVIWAVGDGNAQPNGSQVAARIGAAPFDRLLYLGDVYEDGTANEFANNYAGSYGRFAAKTAPTPGNHDWPNHTSGYDPYWQRALQRAVGPWYTFRAGGWQILSLNSETDHGRGSPQYRWVRSQVRKRGTCRIAFWHRPRYSAGTRHGDQGDVAPLWQALRGRVAIILNGHEHDMQRFRPVGGITEFVSGAGGNGHYSLRPDRRLAFGNDSEFGALKLDLRPGVASYAFVAVSGRVLDRGTIRCR